MKMRYLIDYSDKTSKGDEQKISSAKAREIGRDKEQTIKKAFEYLKRTVSLTSLGEAYDLVLENEGIDGLPTSFWGLAQGITRLSQQCYFAE